MTLPPNASRASGGEQGKRAVSGDSGRDLRFSSLEFQLDEIPSLADRITRKHWPRAEKEQYPFWIGIFIIALFGIFGMAIRSVSYFGLYIALVMLIIVVPLIFYHLKIVGGRFERLWQTYSGDGELFRFLRDASLMLGYPIELGKPDEHFTTHLNIPFSETVSAVVTYLKSTALPDPKPLGSHPGLKISDLSLGSPGDSASHKVFQAEYLGSISRALSIRVNAADAGSDVTVGFTMRPSNAETRDKLANGLAERLQDRFIAAQILADVREVAGIEPISIPATGSEQPPMMDRIPSRAI